MGQAAYVLSRTAQTGACNTKTCPPPPAGGGNPPDYQAAAQAYLKEITSGATPLQTWLYPDVNASYQFTMQQTVCTDPLASSSRLGEMLFVSAVGGAAACPPAPPASGVPIATKCPAPSGPWRCATASSRPA
jgi:hypothetical protein